MDTRKEEDMRKRSEYKRAQKEQEYSYHLQEAENRYGRCFDFRISLHRRDQ